MKTMHLVTVGVGGIAIAAMLWVWVSSRNQPDPPAPVKVAETEVPPDSPAAPEAPAPVALEPPRRETNLMYRRPSPEAMEKIMANEDVMERAAEQQRQAQAANRFSEGVNDGHFEADDINRSVVAMFDSVELEPVLDEDGMILGLEIRNIYPDSPLSDAGFRSGDRITAINDEPLHDPVDVPAALARLERDLSLCVDRDGTEICQRLVLD